MLSSKTPKEEFLQKFKNFFRKHRGEYKERDYTFKPITNDDSDLITKIYSDVRTRAYGFGREVSMDYVKTFFTNPTIASSEKQNHFLVYKGKDFVGRTLFRMNDEADVHWGVAITPDYQGRGVGAEVGNIMMKLAFTEFDFDVVHATALSYNHNSQRLMYKMGMIPGGVVPKTIPNAYDTYSVSFFINKEIFSEGSGMTTMKTHPLARSLKEVIMTDYKSSLSFSKEEFITSPEIKRMKLYAELELGKKEKFNKELVKEIVTEKKRIDEFNDFQAMKTSFLAFSLVEIIENMETTIYFYNSIKNSMFYNSSELNENTAISVNSNYLIAAHFMVGSIAAYNIPSQQISLSNKILIPISLSSNYAVRKKIEEMYKDSFLLSVDLDDNYIIKCGWPITLAAASGAVSSMIMIGTTGVDLKYIGIGAATGALLGNVQCYEHQREQAFKSYTIVEKVIPYIIDFSAFIFMSSYMNINFDTYTNGVMSIKQGIGMLNTLATVDMLSHSLIGVIGDFMTDEGQGGEL